MRYRVTAPYVTLKVRDFDTAWKTHGFHVNAVLSGDDLHEEDVARHLRKGMIEALPEPEPEPEVESAPDAEPEVVAETEAAPAAAVVEEPAPAKPAKATTGKAAS